MRMKKTVFTIFFAIVLLAASATGVYAYTTPVKYISLDINPSVELAVNTFNIVIDAQAMNEDAETILEGHTVKNMSVEKAVNTLVESAVDNNYIAADGSSVISITTEAEDEEENEELQEQCSNGVSLAMSNKSAIAAMYQDSSDPALREEAKTLGISPGKYKLIKMLQTIDPTITVEEYKDAKVNEIIRKANELLVASGYEGKQNEELDEIADQLEGVNEELEENEGNGEDEQDVDDEDENDDENEDENEDDDEDENDDEDEQNVDDEDEDNDDEDEDNDNVKKEAVDSENDNHSTKANLTNNGKSKK